MATFAEKLKMMRHKAGWSQREVAEKLGITPRAYAAYELEGSKPRDIEKYYKLANIFNVSKNYFLDEPDFFQVCAEKIFNGLTAARKEEYSPDELADFYVAELKTYMLEDKISPEKSEKIIKELMTAYWFARGV
jgi:transcriptional regulator with XRE-family HTH domain